MIFPADEFLEPILCFGEGKDVLSKCVLSAIQGLRSVISAAGLPFQLTQDSVLRNNLSRIHASERIRLLAPIDRGEMSAEEADTHAYINANEKMKQFLETQSGQDIVRDSIIYILDSHLNSPEIRDATKELMIQTLISAWSVFENFSRSFVIEWINENPARAHSVLNSPDLRDLFGRQTIDFQTIGEHNFDLSNSMGEVLFRGRRLDSLKTIKLVFKSLFNSSDVQSSLGDLQTLNQRRHLFAHNRGIVDREYLKLSGDDAPLGEHLFLKCDDIERHLVSVRSAIISIFVASKSD